MRLEHIGIAVEDLEKAITPKTKWLILNSPSNPTGAAYSREEMKALTDVLLSHPHVWVMSDDMYEHLVYDGFEFVTPAQVEPKLYERTLTVNGVSKAYAMTGWRLGYLAAEKPITQAAAKVQSQTTSAPSTISQMAGLAALEMDMEPVREMVAAFRERRDYVLERLRAIPRVRCPKPEGAFYLFPDVSGLLDTRTPEGRQIATSDDLCFYLLEEHDVALVPGGAFGMPQGLRISYAASREELETAMDRIERGVEALS